MIAPIAFVFGLLSLVSAAPLGMRDVPISTCTIIQTGVLKADGHLIGISKDKTVSIGTSSKQLVATFQSCQPNFGHYDGSPVGGHLVDTSTNKCLSLKPGFNGPPFTLTVDDCYFSDDSGQVFQNFIKDSDNRIWFVGGTQKDKSEIWYGKQCHSGIFGIDRTTQKGPVELKCVDGGNVESFELE